MRRHAFNMVAALSMVLLLVVALSWAAALVLSVWPRAGRWMEPYVAWRLGPTRGRTVMVTRGSVTLEGRSLPWAMPEWPGVSIYDPAPDHAVESIDRMRVRMVRIAERKWLGFEKGYWAATVGNGFVSGPTRGEYVSVPVWFALVAFATLPTWWVAGARRERRRRRGGLCRRCGYDLRATPERCPECGAVRNEEGRGRRGGMLTES